MIGFKSLAYKVINSGIKPEYKPWEISITRKINYVMLISFMTLAIALIIYQFNPQFGFINLIYIVSITVPAVWLSNRYFGYITAG
jgi:hypothetical protein